MTLCRTRTAQDGTRIVWSRLQVEKPLPDGEPGIYALEMDRADLQPSVGTIDSFLASLMRGEDATWSGQLDEDCLAGRIAYHGIGGMIANRNVLPAHIAARVMARARAVAMWEMRHAPLLRQVIEALGDAGLEPILLKGSALAYSLYPNPAWRERGDSDILIRPGGAATARKALDALGLKLEPGEGLGERFRLQEVWSCRFGDGTVHDFDLHFAPLNTPLLATRLSHADAKRDSVSLATLGRHGVAPSLAFLLVHACLHRKGHEWAPYKLGRQTYLGGDRLIWLIDIKRIVLKMSKADWVAFYDLARRSGEAATCAEGLAAAQRWLGTPLPQGEPLTTADRSYYDASPIHRAWRDATAVPGIAARAAYVVNRLFPPRAFLRAKYGGSARVPIAFLYLRRFGELAGLGDRP